MPVTSCFFDGWMTSSSNSGSCSCQKKPCVFWSSGVVVFLLLFDQWKKFFELLTFCSTTICCLTVYYTWIQSNHPARATRLSMRCSVSRWRSTMIQQKKTNSLSFLPLLLHTYSLLQFLSVWRGEFKMQFVPSITTNIIQQTPNAKCENISSL